MRIGYPCKNLALKNINSTTFRIKSYSEKRFKETVKNNLNHLQKILEFNLNNNILFFRLSSDIIPFASHPICKVDWRDIFKKDLEKIGDYINKNNMRISMHPDQFVILNSKNDIVIENSIRELQYHADLLESMKMPLDAKIQIHVGGIYDNKSFAKKRFIKTFKNLEENLKNRIIIENDDRLYPLKDCIEINNQTGIPIVFDIFHHECLNNKESTTDALISAANTWKYSFDGFPIIDYSSQSIGERKGKHAKTLNKSHFIYSYNQIKKINRDYSIDFDIMLEIKDKENSTFLALDFTKSLKNSNKVSKQ
jgi:UV DNA damage endonuclease